MQLANVRKALYGFSFANMEICRTHGLWGGPAAAAHSWVRKLPDGNNESHKNGILISFQRKKRQVRPSSGPKLIAPLWSHSQKRSDEDTRSPTVSPDEIQLQKEGGGGSAAAAFFCSKALTVLAKDKSPTSL